MQSNESFLKYPGKVFANDDFVFISDSGNHRIIISDLQGKVHFVIGDAGIKGHSDGSLTEARFDSPQGLAFDKVRKCLYVCDTNNHAIRCMDLEQRQVSTISGNGNQSLNSSMPNGHKGLEVALASPWDLCLNQDNTGLYIAMAGSHQIWLLNLDTNILSLKGTN